MVGSENQLVASINAPAPAIATAATIPEVVTTPVQFMAARPCDFLRELASCIPLNSDRFPSQGISVRQSNRMLETISTTNRSERGRYQFKIIVTTVPSKMIARIIPAVVHGDADRSFLVDAPLCRIKFSILCLSFGCPHSHIGSFVSGERPQSKHRRQQSHRMVEHSGHSVIGTVLLMPQLKHLPHPRQTESVGLQMLLHPEQRIKNAEVVVMGSNR